MSGAHRARPPRLRVWAGRAVLGVLAGIATACAGYCFVLAWYALGH